MTAPPSSSRQEEAKQKEKQHVVVRRCSSFFLSWLPARAPMGMALKASNVVGNPVTLHQIW
jgi:hypothetical protein